MATKKSSSSSTSKTTSSKTTTTTPRQDISGGQGFFVGGTTTSSSAPKPVAAPKPATVTKTTKTSSNLAPGVVAGFMDGSGFDASGKVIPSVKPVSPVTTSDPARDTYAALKDKINKLGSNTLDYSSYLNTSDPMSGLLNDQRKSLQQRKTAEIGRIQSEYSDRQAGQVQQQKSETGTQSMGLARIGGFDSASGQAVLTNLQRTHEAEQNTLMQARQSAILQAQQAYEDKDFALAKLQIDEAKAAEALMYNRSQDFIRNTLAINQDERANAQIEYGKSRDQLNDQRQAAEFAFKHNINTPFYFIGGVGYDSSTGEALPYEEYIKRGGAADFKSNATVITPGSEMERQFIMDLASKYPDAPINILTDDLATARERINGSRIYQEQVRPPQRSGGGSGSKDGMIASFLQTAKGTLDEERANSGDGYANPDTYRQAKAAYISEKGSATNFFQMFPPEVYISPANRKGDLDVYKKESATQDEEFQQFMTSFVNSSPTQ